MIVVLLVRHADIDLPPPPGSNDPPLNAAGRARAEALAHVAGRAGVTTIFTSPFVRTKQTVEPLAARSGLRPRQVPPPPALANEVLSGAAGAVVLIAGHSNTVPEMIAALGVPPPRPTIGEREFDNLFVVAVAGSGQAGLISLKFWERSA
jgi:phosphohistidine phosphatase SixA